MESNARTIVLKNKELAELRKEQRKHEKALEAARADQAKSKTNVMQVEKALKRAEKALESKVSPSNSSFISIIKDHKFQKPELVAADAQIAHVTRKLGNATKTKEDVFKSEETLSSRLEALRKELANTKKAADKAQEEQRKASRQNLALSEESLDEYRKLSVLLVSQNSISL